MMLSTGISTKRDLSGYATYRAVRGCYLSLDLDSRQCGAQLAEHASIRTGSSLLENVAI
jgi:hypothetical protein